MLTAEDARNIADEHVNNALKEELQKIDRLINNASFLGKYKTTCNPVISKEAKKSLIDNGFEVFDDKLPVICGTDIVGNPVTLISWEKKMEYNQISAEDARREVDRLIEAENVEPRRELNEVYGEIHKAIRDKQYCILVEIQYESTKSALENNGYKVTVVCTKVVQDLVTNREYNVVDVRIDWRK